jgi:hypothetical protein
MQYLSRSPLEMADIVRYAGQGFIDRNRRWLNGQHEKVRYFVWLSPRPPELLGLPYCAWDHYGPTKERDLNRREFSTTSTSAPQRYRHQILPVILCVVVQ